MDILIIGGGGREHAIAWKVSKSNKVKPKRSICRRTRKALRADKWWCSAYLKQMLQKNRCQ